PAGGATWSATVASVDGNATLEYYVRATDDLGAVGTAPATAPTDLYSVWVAAAPGGAKVVLFDHAHDQDAGSSGNWRVDDNHPDPLPAVPTSETSWSGQLSSWGYELYLAGHTVKSTTALLSASVLAGVDMLVIPEPQNPFTAAEIEAVRQFVFGGGSLFFIADHNSSDRNSNGWDSASIFGGYSAPHISTPVGSDVETFCGALFGLHVHVKDEGSNGISGTFTNVDGDPANPVIHGAYGDVTSLVWHVGNVISLWPAANADISMTGGLVSASTGDPYVMAWSRYGAGKVVGWGDSSSMADGTDTETHADNWHEASHRAAFLNASLWLLEGQTVSGVDDGGVPAPFGPGLRAWPNPFNPSVTIAYAMPAAGAVTLEVHDVAGRLVRRLFTGTAEAGEHTAVWDGRDDAGRAMPSGVYLVTARGGAAVNAAKIVLAK
ncbi:MAG TPA: FlgD immunoglobulin-like domain containing protein, partial [Candidatus Krumholzibacteria bacterium]|nr:FlgD immunoglobulin-like domain containing protein [Candidatus Krumholzibacteria bacterium]